MEEWKIIEGFDKYEISNLGNIRSYCNNRHGKSETPKLLKPTLSKTLGYFYCSCGAGNKRYVHFLVATAFIPNPNNYTYIDHINRDRKDNRVENLRWCTQSQNIRNTGIPKHNTSGEKHIRWCDIKKSWQVQVVINKKKYSRRIKEFDEAVKYRDETISTFGNNV